MMSRKNRKKAQKKKLKDLASIRGIERAEHFKNGGTLQQWRGLHRVHSTVKRQSRGSVQKDAIKDSKD